MRLLNYLPHPKYFFIAGLIGICISVFLSLGTFSIREQISSYELYWSPDSSKLAFIAIEDNSFSELFVIRADRSNLIQLTPQIYTGYLPLRWSPDSMTIYYKLDASTFNNDVGTWHHITLDSSSGSNNLIIDPYQNPIASEEEIDVSIITRAETDEYYAVVVCPDPRFQQGSDFPIDECEKRIDVYSATTDELIWSFGKCQYDEARYGRSCFIDVFGLLPVSSITIVIGIIVATLRKFRRPDTRKAKSKNDEI